jgi:hypothetical protein
MDEGQSSEVTVLSVDPAGSASRKKVSVVLAQISKEDFAEMADWANFNQHEAAKGTRPHMFTNGHWPRGTALRQVMTTGPLHAWIRSLPAETEVEHYLTAAVEGGSERMMGAPGLTPTANGASALIARAQECKQA